MSLPLAKRPAESPAGQNSRNVSRERFAGCKRELATLLTKVQTLRLVMSHPSTPISAKVVAACALAYLVSPIQLIPTFIPVIGQLDDLVVVLLGIRLVRWLTPAAILAECEERARSAAVVVCAEEKPKRHYAPSTENS